MATTNPAGRPIFWFILAVVVARILASIVLPVYDDAFITFRYARNLAEGDGFVYNDGAWVLGTTAPAFGLLSALLYATGLPFPASVLAFNILCDALAVYVTARALAGGAPPLTIALFATFFALHPMMARVSVGLMEMSLFVLCSITAVYLYLQGRWVLGAVLAASAYFLRPEAVVLVGLFGLSELKARRIGRAALIGVIALAVVTPPLVLMYGIYGNILPQSLLAKSRDLDFPVGHVLGKLFFNTPLTFVLLPFAAWGVVVGWRASAFLQFVTLWAAIWLTAYLVARPEIWSWYGQPLHYVETLLAAVGLADLLGRVPLAFVQRHRRWVALGPAAAVLVWLAVVAKLGPSPITRHVYGDMRRWCDQNLQRGETIFALDIGAVGYYCDGLIYDFHGLVYPDALRFGSDAIAAIQEYRPEYVLLAATQPTADMMTQPPLGPLYRPVARFDPDPQPGGTDLRQTFPPLWVQDYLLFKRTAEQAEIQP